MSRDSVQRRDNDRGEHSLGVEDRCCPWWINLQAEVRPTAIGVLHLPRCSHLHDAREGRRGRTSPWADDSRRGDYAPPSRCSTPSRPRWPSSPSFSNRYAELSIPSLTPPIGSFGPSLLLWRGSPCTWRTMSGPRPTTGGCARCKASRSRIIAAKSGVHSADRRAWKRAMPKDTSLFVQEPNSKERPCDLQT